MLVPIAIGKIAGSNGASPTKESFKDSQNTLNRMIQGVFLFIQLQNIQVCLVLKK